MTDQFSLSSYLGTPIDLTIEGTWRRVAHTLSGAERRQPHLWAEPFYEAVAGDSWDFLDANHI